MTRRTGCLTERTCLRKQKPDPSGEEVAAKELVRLAREPGLSLTGPGGLLKQHGQRQAESADVAHQMLVVGGKQGDPGMTGSRKMPVEARRCQQCPKPEHGLGDGQAAEGEAGDEPA